MITTSWLASILSKMVRRNLVLFRRIHALAKEGDWVAIGVVLLATGLSAQPRANPRSGYVGSQTCGGCHANISKKQELSNHALSLRAPGDIGELYGSLPFQFQDRSSQAILTFRRNAGNQLELEASKGIQRELLTLRWAFGSGARGITPVGVRSDATFVESRLSCPLRFSRGKLTTAGIYTSSHFDRVILPYGNRRRYRKTLTFRFVSNAISNSIGEAFLF